MKIESDSMSEPVNIEERKVEEAFHVLKETAREFEKDIDDFEDFVETVFDTDFQSSPRTNNGLMNLQNGNNGDSVIDIYEEKFYVRQTATDRVEAFAENLDLSMPAADLFDELANSPRVDKDAAYNVVASFERNNVNQIVLQNFEDMADAPVKLREKVGEDLETEKESLWHYHKEISSLYDKVDSLNRENTLPMDFDTALDVVNEFEEIEERAEQLKNRRIHELRRRDEYMKGDMDTHEERFYEDEDFQRPVLEELDRINEYIEEATENIVLGS